MTNEINPMQETGVNQTDYLKLFMQELTYQDPLKPVDNREFMAQMAQFSSLQEARSTNGALSELIIQTSANRSLMMLGKQVRVDGSDATGQVTHIQFSATQAPLLTIAINGEIVQKQLGEITDVY